MRTMLLVVALLVSGCGDHKVEVSTRGDVAWNLWSPSAKRGTMTTGYGSGVVDIPDSDPVRAEFLRIQGRDDAAAVRVRMVTRKPFLFPDVYGEWIAAEVGYAVLLEK